jgi:hypothetical protein
LLNDYKKAVEEAGVSVLDSGEVDRVFFVVGRAQADLCLFVQNRVGEQKGWKVQCTAVAGSKKLSIDLMGILSRARAQNLPMWLGPRFFYQIPANYRGDVAITVEYRTAKQLPLTFSRTVHWPG